MLYIIEITYGRLFKAWKWSQKMYRVGSLLLLIWLVLLIPLKNSEIFQAISSLVILFFLVKDRKWIIVVAVIAFFFAIFARGASFQQSLLISSTVAVCEIAYSVVYELINAIYFHFKMPQIFFHLLQRL